MERTDLHVEWTRNPRLIVIERSPIESELVGQDLVDTVRGKLGLTPQALDYPSLLDASGKEDLGGGVKVGITIALNNAQIAFESDYTAIANGASTTPNLQGVLLVDSQALFLTNAVEQGATIINLTTSAASTVKEILSETQLTHYVLTDGTRNTWEIGDLYKIWNIKQCSLTGGNFTSLDEVGNPITPVAKTAFTQVIMTSSSSATLSELKDIQHSSFGNCVTFDPLSAYSGIAYPTGTPLKPVNNLKDVKSIAAFRGFDHINLIGNYTFKNTENIDGFSILGQNPIKTKITVTSGCSTIGCNFKNASIEGSLSGNVWIEGCTLYDLTYVEGDIRNCVLFGTILLSGAQDTRIYNCYDGLPGNDAPVINMGGSGRGLAIAAHCGDLKITNLTGDEKVSIESVSGFITLDSTVHAGHFWLKGVGRKFDFSTNTIIDDSAFLSLDAIENYVWDSATSNHIQAGSFGEAARKLLGLGQENFRIFDQVYDNSGNLTSATIRIYANASNCQAGAPILASYSMLATYQNKQCTGYMVTEV